MEYFKDALDTSAGATLGNMVVNAEYQGRYACRCEI